MPRRILGIDEAGRGAVLGPLVVAGVLFEDDKKVFEELGACGVCDSKLLTTRRRAELATVVRRLKLRHMSVRITPERIDLHSLNDLEIKHSSCIINRLKPHVVYLDVPATGAGITNYCDAIRRLCGHSCKINGGNRLDYSNVAVAASSIIAKEAREAEVRKLHKIYGDFGSGYPSDPRTRLWLKKQKRNEWPEIVRTKWATLARI